jgi:hypothetical protein
MFAAVKRVVSKVAFAVMLPIIPTLVGQELDNPQEPLRARPALAHMELAESLHLANVPVIVLKSTTGPLVELMRNYLDSAANNGQDYGLAKLPSGGIAFHAVKDLPRDFADYLQRFVPEFMKYAYSRSGLFYDLANFQPHYEIHLPGVYLSSQEYARVCRQGSSNIHRDVDSYPKKESPMGFTFSLSYNHHDASRGDLEQVFPGTAFFTQDLEPRHLATISGEPGVVMWSIFNRYTQHAPGYGAPISFLENPERYFVARSFLRSFVTAPPANSVNWDAVGQLTGNHHITNQAFAAIDLSSGDIAEYRTLCEFMDHLTIALKRRMEAF